MSTLLEVKWERFFENVGIPAKIAEAYAKRFAEQRVQFTMLAELTKPILVELGITALGDQMAILRHVRIQKEGNQEKMDINDSPPLTSSGSMKGSKNNAGSVGKVLKAPDRDDIYHVRMPSGITPKTKEIMKKQNLLKTAGLMQRGSNGVRKSGQEVKPVSKVSLSRTVGNSASSASQSEVSSTTADVYGRLGVRGLVSDSMPEPKVFEGVARSTTSLYIQRKKKDIDPAALFKRSISETTGVAAGEPVFRVRIPVEDAPSTSKAGIRERINFRARSDLSKGRPILQRKRVGSTGRIQKKRSIQSRLSVGDVHVLSSKRMPKRTISVFDRLG